MQSVLLSKRFLWQSFHDDSGSRITDNMLVALSSTGQADQRSVDGYPAIQMEGSVSIYNEPLILWFEDTPLIASCYNDFVVNPVYADEKKDALADISGLFSSVIGARLNAVRYVEMSNCCFAFSNGKHLSFMSRDIGEGNQVGSFDIAPDSEKAESE